MGSQPQKYSIAVQVQLLDPKALPKRMCHSASRKESSISYSALYIAFFRRDALVWSALKYRSIEPESNSRTALSDTFVRETLWSLTYNSTQLDRSINDCQLGD